MCKTTTLLTSFLLFFGTIAGYGQGSTCMNIEPFCAGDESLIFANCNPNQPGCDARAEQGPNYSCLGSQPFPAWFFLQVENSGDLSFEIIQNSSFDANGNPNGDPIDVDFIAWGPFPNSNTNNLCDTSMLQSSNEVDCSFSSAAVERFTIQNAVRNEVYVLMITNFDEMPGFIKLNQINNGTTNDGTTDCSILNPLETCEGETVTLDGTNPETTNYLWEFDDGSGFVTIFDGDFPTIDVGDDGLYRVTYTENGNMLMGPEFDLTVNPDPDIFPMDDVTQCEIDDGSSIFDLTTYNEQITGDSPVPSNKTVVYYASPEDFTNDNPIPESQVNNFRNTSNPQEIIARVRDLASGCQSESTIRFTLDVLDEPVFPDQLQQPQGELICVDQEDNIAQPFQIGYDLGATDGMAYIYDWTPDNRDTDGDGNEDAIYMIETLTEITTYAVTITRINDPSNGLPNCSNNIHPPTREPYEVTFTPSKTPIAVTAIVEEDFFSDAENSYTITATPRGASRNALPIDNFLYRIDDRQYQESNVFEDTLPGTHVVWATDKNQCGEVVSEPFTIIDYPRFFTPNNDGFNDTWNITGIDQQPDARIFIFDRFGKLLKQLSPSGNGWDGTFNGRNLPSADYWFLVKYRQPEDDTPREFKANFTLKR